MRVKRKMSLWQLCLGAAGALCLAVFVVPLGCESPREPVGRLPAPAVGPQGAWREMQNALLARNTVWLDSRIATVATPAVSEGPLSPRMQMTRDLLDEVAPLVDQALVVTDEPEVWLRYDRHGIFVGGRATLRASVKPLLAFDRGESLAEWTARLAEDPDADPQGAKARPLMLITQWVVEDDDWRLRELSIVDPDADPEEESLVWQLRTRDES